MPHAGQLQTCALFIGMLTFDFAAPAQQAIIRCYECSIMGNGRCGDKPVGGIAMQIFKFNREQRHLPCQGEFKDASIKQFCS